MSENASLQINEKHNLGMGKDDTGTLEDWKFVTNEIHDEFPNLEIFNALAEKLFEYSEFDQIDIETNMQERQSKFSQCSDEDKQVLEQALIHFARSNRPRLLESLKITGRETDSTLIDELEEKYNINLNRARIATYIFGLTYNLWQSNYLLKSVDQTSDTISTIYQLLIDAVNKAQKLSQYVVNATHATAWDYSESINQGQVILKSDTDYSSQFEGDGTYLGIMGCYKDWHQDGTIYNCNIPLADTLPIIVSFNYPKAMCVALGEGLDIKDYRQSNSNFASQENSDLSITTGLIQWHQEEFSNDPIEDWKVELIEKLLGCKVDVYQDKDHEPCLVGDTNADPIVWAVIARALRIRRFIPKSQIAKANFPTDELLQEEPPESYVQHSNEIRRIKGLPSDERVEY